MELPPLHDSASAMSLRAQHAFLWSTRVQLAMLIAGAIGGTVTVTAGSSETPVGAAVGLAAFIIAVLVRSYALATRPESRWYEGRAAAESVKTLAWRYAVGGEPFRVSADGDADSLFVQRINDVLSSLDRLEEDHAGAAQITNAMRDLRGSSLADRKAAYERDRIQDQQTWYAGKSRWNRTRALLWGILVLGLQIAGALAAVAHLAKWMDVSVLGIAAASSAAATAWLQSRQHESLTTAYSVASQELASVRSLIGKPDDEESWSQFVEDAEEAISREHTMWRASRGLRRARWG